MRVFVFTRDNSRVDEWLNFAVKARDVDHALNGLREWLVDECYCGDPDSGDMFENRKCSYCDVDLDEFNVKEIDLEEIEFEMILAESDGG